VILTVSWCGRKPENAAIGVPLPTPPAATPTPSSPTPSPAASAVAQVTPTPPLATPPPELRKVAQKVAPAVVELTLFDLSGQLLRNTTGFFVSKDGELLTNLSAVENAAHGVAKSPDGKIRNVSGILASSSELDLAVLKADTLTGVPFIPLSKNVQPESGAWLAVIEAPIRHREQTLLAGTVSAPTAEEPKDRVKISVPLPNDVGGSPVVDINGQVAGVVTSVSEQGGSPRTIIRSAPSLDPLITQVKPSATARWAVAEPQTPTPSPRPSLVAKRRVLYNPAPKYPGTARFAGLRGSGRFRLVFGTDGTVKNIQVLSSTGQPILDQSAVEALRQWKAEPGPEWTILVPITFSP
jgi:TonB family protein